MPLASICINLYYSIYILCKCCQSVIIFYTFQFYHSVPCKEIPLVKSELFSLIIFTVKNEIFFISGRVLLTGFDSRTKGLSCTFGTAEFGVWGLGLGGFEIHLTIVKCM